MKAILLGVFGLFAAMGSGLKIDHENAAQQMILKAFLNSLQDKNPAHEGQVESQGIPAS